MLTLLRRHATVLIVCVAVLCGAIGRGTSLYDWDGPHTLHPDERFLVYTVLRLSLPDTWSAYVQNDCAVDGKVPAPSATRDLRGIERAPHEWEPSRASGCNSLNPRNFGWSQRFVYGTFPTTMVRVLSDWVFGRDATALEIRNTGRTLAWFSDVVAIVLIFWLARAVLPARASAWAALLYALAPLPMQLSHFFTMDAIVSPWVVAALGAGVRLHHSRWRDWLLFAVCVAVASAIRITMISLAIIALVVWVRQLLPWSWRSLGMVLSAAGAGVLLLWIADPTWWQNGWFEQRWLADIGAAGRIVAGDVDTPPTFQWADATPWLYPWWQLSWWGIGPVVATFALYGVWIILGRRWRPVWLLVVWVVGFFVWQGGVFGMTMRYYLPMYAGLIIVAMLALAGVARRWRRVVCGIMVLASVIPAVAWQQMYREPHPRIAASAWMYEHIPAGTTIAVEQWDDALPVGVGDNTPGRYQFVELKVFAPDRPAKYLTIDGTTRGFIEQIATADYIVLSSARAHAVIPDMPLRFPVMTRYYAMLFDGQLGYTLRYQAARWPRIGPWWRDTRSAEEALSVYDHPQVWIFENRARLDAHELTRRLLADVQWSTVAHTTTKMYRTYPTMGLMDAPMWQALTATQRVWHGQGGWVVWLLLVDGLMLLLVPWLGRWRDHGVTVGRAIGMVVLIGVSGLALQQSTIMLGLGVCVPVAVWAWWQRRRQIVAQIRQTWQLVLGGELIWLLMVAVALWWAGGVSTPHDWWRQVAIINQQLRVDWPTIADPWLAGFVALDASGIWRATAVLARLSGSDGATALTLMLATAVGVLSQLMWYVVNQVPLSLRQYVWRMLIIVGVLSAGTLVPLVRAAIGVADPLWVASHTADVQGWVPTTVQVALTRADSQWLWQSVWWSIVALFLWQRQWWWLAGMLCCAMSMGDSLWWWGAVIACSVVLWYWWRQRLGWIALIALAVLTRDVTWQLPHGSATMALLHLWPMLGLLAWHVWLRPQRDTRDLCVAALWLVWGVFCAWGQLPIWMLLIGWWLCLVVVWQRHYWWATALVAGMSIVYVLPLSLMQSGYQLITLVVWGLVGWQMCMSARVTWVLLPALVWLVWLGSLTRPTLSPDDRAMVMRLARVDADAVVVVDADVQRAMRVAATRGGMVLVAPPSQLDARWLSMGWRDEIRQRWQYTQELNTALLCAHHAHVDLVIQRDGLVERCGAP